jgi:hypothetical protein
MPGQQQNGQQQNGQQQQNSLAIRPPTSTWPGQQQQGMGMPQQGMPSLQQMGQNMGSNVMSMAQNIGNFFTGGTNVNWNSAPGATSYDTSSKQFGYPTQQAAPGASAEDTAAMEAE